MKRLITLALLVSLVTSCKKEQLSDSKSVNCYECNFDNTQWIEMGCMTQAEWDAVQFQDYAGNPQSKSHCRKK